MKKLLLLAAAAILSACTLLPTQTQQVQAACASITASVQTLTFYKDRLTESQIASVGKSLDAIYPVCGQGPEPGYDTVKLAALTALNKELSQLILEIK